MATPDDLDPRRERRRRQADRRRRVRMSVAGVMVMVAGVIGALVSQNGNRDNGGTTSGATTPTTTTPVVVRPHHVTPRPSAVPLRLPLHSARTGITVPVLMYHRVAPRSTATNAVSRDLTVNPASFRAQMRWLAAAGYHPVSQTSVFRAVFDGAPLPPRPLVITFDDGYVDAVTYVAPVLAPRHWPATFFIITGRVGARAFLTWPQLRRLDRMGMDIGSHTVSHLELPTLSTAARMQQLQASRRVLEAHLGHPVQWFAYPAGRFDTASAQDVRRAGYVLAYTTQPSSRVIAADAVTEGRVRVHGDTTLSAFQSLIRTAEAARG